MSGTTDAPLRALSTVGAIALKAPLYLYRYTLSMLIGRTCRHLPTCSQYALDAIDLNGPWRGLWLTMARCSRCHPFESLGASSGFDPAPDIRAEHHRCTPWRYGRWRLPPSSDASEAGSTRRNTTSETTSRPAATK